jgi:hypothetical protein
MKKVELEKLTLEELKKLNKQLEKDLKMVANEMIKRLQR